MRGSRPLLVAAAVALSAGCRLFDRERNRDRDRDRPSADPAGRTKDKDRPSPRSWLDDPASPSRIAADPADPRSPKFDARTASRRIISGVLEDDAGRRVTDAYVTIDAYDPAAAGTGSPVGVMTDPNGFFVFTGLASGQTYVLTANVKVGGKPLAGRQYVKVPNERVRLTVKDDVTLGPAVRADATADLPPAVPGGGPSLPSVFDPPATAGRDKPGRPPTASPDPLHMPAESGGPDAPPLLKPPPPKNDLVAPIGKDWKGAPPANIPGPVPPPDLGGRTSKRAADATTIRLVGGTGRPRELTTGRRADLFLLDFMTTTCVPCKRALPAVTGLQARYEADGLEVVGVVCDAGTPARRQDLAADYQRANRLNYRLYAEADAGELQDAYRVEAYPTLVLIDGTGKSLWRGHPKDVGPLDAAVRDALDARK